MPWQLRIKLIAAGMALPFAVCPFRAEADDLGPPLPRGIFSSVGMIDMPTARMAPDSQLYVGASFFENTQHYTLGFQAVPWLDLSFRYSGLSNFKPGIPVYFDRSFAARVRLWDESDSIPAVVIGINDVIGTGIYSGEYVVASKQLGPVDASLGIGWGRLGTYGGFKNPLSLISDSFLVRGPTATFGGQFQLDNYFHGPTAALFGGLNWRTPVDRLTLSVEYSSDRYVEEELFSNFTRKSPINFAASYQLFNSSSASLGWLYGRSLYGSLTFSFDPSANSFPQRFEAPLPQPTIRSPEQQQYALAAMAHNPAKQAPLPSGMISDILWRDTDLRDASLSGRTLLVTVNPLSRPDCAGLALRIALYSDNIDTITINGGQTCPVPSRSRVDRAAAPLPGLRLAASGPIVIDAAGPAPVNRQAAIAAIRRSLGEQGIVTQAVALNGGEAVIYYSQDTYASEKDVIGRLVQTLMAEAPPDIERFRLIPILNGVPETQYEILRAPVERGFSQEGDFDFFRDQGQITPAPLADPILRDARRGSYPRFEWSVFPQFHQQMFDPNNPIGIDLSAGAAASLEIVPGFQLTGQVEADVFNTFDTSRASDSVLPHVRSDYVRYFSKGKSGIGDLEANYNFRIAPNAFVSLRAGYLESMFAGFGGEILWRPEGQRWAMGADIYHVYQREYDRLFGLLPYSQTTGHFTLYYEMPWYDLNFQVRVGRYLAGDWGSTIQLTRRFASGIEVGFFATKTNVTPAQFGEGSFDKGIVISIPLEAILPMHTPRAYSTVLRPVQRDGGQTLLGDAMLYDATRRTSEGELRRQYQQ